MCAAIATRWPANSSASPLRAGRTRSAMCWRVSPPGGASTPPLRFQAWKAPGRCASISSGPSPAQSPRQISRKAGSSRRASPRGALRSAAVSSARGSPDDTTLASSTPSRLAAPHAAWARPSSESGTSRRPYTRLGQGCATAPWRNRCRRVPPDSRRLEGAAGCRFTGFGTAAARAEVQETVEAQPGGLPGAAIAGAGEPLRHSVTVALRRGGSHEGPWTTSPPIATVLRRKPHRVPP